MWDCNECDTMMFTEQPDDGIEVCTSCRNKYFRNNYPEDKR